MATNHTLKEWIIIHDWFYLDMCSDGIHRRNSNGLWLIRFGAGAAVATTSITTNEIDHDWVGPTVDILAPATLKDSTYPDEGEEHCDNTLHLGDDQQEEEQEEEDHSVLESKLNP